MNERIKSLIERAEYQAKKQSGYEDWEVYVTPDSQVVFEKFAELIVKECNEVLRLVPYNSNVEFGDEVIYQDAIKKHFGVEL